jgi:membrane protein DedA with SNARE-associated domain
MPAHLLHWITTYGLAAIVVLLMLGVFGLPVPDETLLTFAGVLVHEGRLPFASTWAAAAFGSMCGITLSYGLGRGFGPAAVAHFGRWFHVRPDDLTRVERWMERSGKWSLTFGYFVPGVRHLTALVAGASQLPGQVFAAYAYSGAVLWSVAFITLGVIVGDRWQPALEAVHRHVIVIIATAALALLIYLVARRAVRRR